jgi:hypothetical protein
VVKASTIRRELRALKDAVERIKPTHVHLNTVTDRRRKRCERWVEATLRNRPFFGPRQRRRLAPTEGRSQESENLEAQVLDMVRRRRREIDPGKEPGCAPVLIVKAVGKLAEEQASKRSCTAS